MAEHEQGYSGAGMARHVATFTTPAGDTQHVSLITKEASLRERRVLALLLSQGQCVPFCHTFDLVTDQPALVCQQDLSTDAPHAPADVARQAARCLARIHAVNRGRAGDLAWLPRADRGYLEEVILADYRQQLARACERPEFSREYGAVVQQIEQAVGPFLAAMETLWQEGDSLTLIHADMMENHVLVSAGHPHLVDWGQARYGPLYLDLPNYFTPDNVLLYREALAEFGHDIPASAFMERYREAGRYPGFKYIGFLLFLWANGGLDSLHGPLLQQLLHGAV
jgi:aminoglycoside phosphotransferase (APT) family kinase protein